MLFRAVGVLLCTAALLGQRGSTKRPPDVVRARTGVSPVPPDVLNAEAAWAGRDFLLPMLDVRQPSPYAIRAIGRLEDPAVVPRLLLLLDSAFGLRDSTAAAIAQSLKGFDPHTNPELVRAVEERLRSIASDPDLLQIASPAVGPLGRIAYGNAADVAAVERALVTVVDRSADEVTLKPVHAAALRSLEWLFRLNAKISTPRAATVAALTAVVSGTSANDTGPAQANAFAALLAARSVNAAAEKAALASDDDEARRMAVTVLAGSGAGLDDDVRSDLILEAVHDPSAAVRYEALRAYVRRVAPRKGCDQILEATRDEASFVRLEAIDALGDACPGDEGITLRLVGESRAPSAVGPWTREAHAFVALARRSRDQAVIAMPRFSHHVIWQVRMYAARVAAILEDVQTLETLAYDASDNVREAALGPLRKLTKEDAEPAIVAALRRPDYQLVRTAATLLKEMGPNPKLARPLVDALKRVTLEGKDTSRDIRVALLEAIEIHAGPDFASELEPLLRDFDPVIAGRVAYLLTKWTGKPRTAEPLTRPHSDGAVGIVPRECLSVRLRKGNIFRMEMDVNAAPLTARHFVQLALKDHYYDGLSFHRVVPNFVIQGGSPGANEYAGQKDFMRDEISALNEVGSVGLSTRGRNTGDAQFFVNLVTNTRLDYDYTIFAHVFPNDMRIVYDVEEGDEIAAISQVDCEPK